jgi:hypothetical protein
MALFLMYESMAATWFLHEKVKQKGASATPEDKDFVLEKLMYELRQWKTIDQPSKQLYHSQHVKSFADFWGLTMT